LISYPVLMLVVPVVWWLRNRGRGVDVPWEAFALVMAPFLIDVTGNTLNLYDSISGWDNVNHFVNWLLLMAGLGLLLVRLRDGSSFLLALSITGLGALLAIGWELGEWYTFIRHGTELSTAYADTLSDEALGTLGGFGAALYVVRRRPRDTEGDGCEGTQTARRQSPPILR
jgi:hypothetical protein